MNDRNELQSIRPTVITEESINSTEHFQNNTLRPILKLQNDLLVLVFQHYIEQRKGVFHKLPTKEQPTYIQNSIQKDGKIRELLLGIIVGHFTTAEWHDYLKEEKNLRKRMIALVVQRIQSQIL